MPDFDELMRLHNRLVADSRELSCTVKAKFKELSLYIEQTRRTLELTRNTTPCLELLPGILNKRPLACREAATAAPKGIGKHAK